MRPSCGTWRHSNCFIRFDESGSSVPNASVEIAVGCPSHLPRIAVCFVFDHQGNLYFSDSGEWDQDNGCLYRLRANGRVERLAGPFAFANGLAISADDRFLYLVESQRDRVLRIPILSDLSLGEPEVYAKNLARVPDGLALDALGNLYVTCYASDCIYVVSPVRKVQLLAFDPEGTRIARPTNASFGGPALEDLYIANLGRWHIGRAHLGTPGQRLVNL